MVDERKLDGKGAVKGIEEGAVPVKNGALVVCLRQLVVDVLIFHALCVEPSVRTADTVLVHLPVGKGLLGGLGSGRFPRPGLFGAYRRAAFFLRPALLPVFVSAIGFSSFRFKKA